MTNTPVVSNQDIVDGFSMLERVAESDYETTLDGVLSITDKSKRNRRFGHIVGVAMKMEFSEPHRMKSKRMANGYDTKWKIDSDQLRKMPDDYWSLILLANSPELSPTSSPKKFAENLRRELWLWRQFKITLHKFICDDPELRKKITEILRSAKLGEFSELTTSKGMIKLAALSLAGVLQPLVGILGAPLVAVFVIVIGALGLDAICSKRCSAETKQPVPIRNPTENSVRPKKKRNEPVASPSIPITGTRSEHCLTRH